MKENFKNIGETSTYKEKKLRRRHDGVASQLRELARSRRLGRGQEMTGVL